MADSSAAGRQRALSRSMQRGLARLARPWTTPRPFSQGSATFHTLASPPTSTNFSYPPHHITNMANEILLNISKSLHPTAMASLSVTCKAMYNFFKALSAPMPKLTATVPHDPAYPSIIHENFFWQLLQNYMEPRIWAGYYGLNKFVNMNLYRELRDQYWALYPQRPFSTDDPSPFVNEGSDTIDVKGTVRELKEKALSERDLTILQQGSPFMRFRAWRRNRRLGRQVRAANPRDPDDLSFFLHPSSV